MLFKYLETFDSHLLHRKYTEEKERIKLNKDIELCRKLNISNNEVVNRYNEMLIILNNKCIIIYEYSNSNIQQSKHNKKKKRKIIFFKDVFSNKLLKNSTISLMFPLVKILYFTFRSAPRKVYQFSTYKNDNGQPCSCFPPFIEFVKNNVPKDAQEV